MNRFWDPYLKSIIQITAPRRIIEIGAARGYNTAHLLEYCTATGCHLSIIDPAPHDELHQVLARYDPKMWDHYVLRSVEAIPLSPIAEIVLIDGDHNWWTVFNELNLLFARAAALNSLPPLILCHDTAWPYGRRDMYYAPETIPEAYRHSFAYRGVLPHRSELVDIGFADHLANATHEGGPRNGVLTAIEDFIAGMTDEPSFYQLPFFNGLGIIVPPARMTPALRSVIDGFFSTQALLRACVLLEESSMWLHMLAMGKVSLTGASGTTQGDGH